MVKQRSLCILMNMQRLSVQYRRAMVKQSKLAMPYTTARPLRLRLQ